MLVYDRKGVLKLKVSNIDFTNDEQDDADLVDANIASLGSSIYPPTIGRFAVVDGYAVDCGSDPINVYDIESMKVQEYPGMMPCLFEKSFSFFRDDRDTYCHTIRIGAHDLRFLGYDNKRSSYVVVAIIKGKPIFSTLKIDVKDWRYKIEDYKAIISRTSNRITMMPKVKEISN